ncbi:MAG TPA: hypothetical protein VE093_09080 [Polyangiaceae bacterium]|nr:hypothetical protein [Polyangiaceae bacterium]
MRRNAILGVLFAGEVFAFVLSLLFYMKTRVAVLEAYREYGTAMPRSTEIALSSWFLPGAMVTAVALSGLAALAPLRRSQRAALLGTGLVLCSMALVYSVWAAFVPLFQLA